MLRHNIILGSSVHSYIITELRNNDIAIIVWS